NNKNNKNNKYNKNKKRKSEKNNEDSLCRSSSATSTSSRSNRSGRINSISLPTQNSKRCNVPKSLSFQYKISKKKHSTKHRTVIDHTKQAILKLKEYMPTLQPTSENRSSIETFKSKFSSSEFDSFENVQIHGKEQDEAVEVDVEEEEGKKEKEEDEIEEGNIQEDVTEDKEKHVKENVEGYNEEHNEGYDRVDDEEDKPNGRKQKAQICCNTTTEKVEKGRTQITNGNTQNENTTQFLIESSKLYKIDSDEHITNFRKMFSKEWESNEINEKLVEQKFNQNDTLDIYINKILKNILNKKKSYLNSLSKNFERIETFYKQNYKVFIIDSKEILNDKRDCFKNDYNVYTLSDEQNDESSNNVDIFEQFKKYVQKEKEKCAHSYQINLTSDPNRRSKRCKMYSKTQINDNKLCIEKKEYRSDDDRKDGNDIKETSLLVGNEQVKTVGNNYGKFNSMKENEVGLFQEKHVDPPYQLDGHTEDGVIFYAFNKKDKKCGKKLKEGDSIYIKFNDSSDDYDKMRILKKKTVIQILIYLIKSQENLKLSNISTYAPDLLWNVSLHFKKNTFDLELNFEKMYKYFLTNYTKEINNDTLYFNEQENDKKKEKIAKKKYQKEMEIMKLKDNVAFLDKFLQNVNDTKLKKLKEAQTEYYEKYEYDRTINRLNKQQLIDLFIDKENEINVIPLSLLKEKSRNIIYEENIKMNMFACIKVIFDDIKGRCIYSASDLNKFDFVFEYVGELLTHNEAMKREQKYIKNRKKGCYMFYFKHENKRYCIDGTEENIDAAINNRDKKYFLRSFARLVNHSKKNANLIPKVLTVLNHPRLFFVASRNIKQGEELLIDYGERDREIIKNNEWLKC
ncbi:SET domain protein, putative, partial [Plasmodium malariae]